MSIQQQATPFSRSDYLGRLARVKQRIKELELDALLVTNGSNIVYLTGYTGDSSYVPQVLIVRPQDEEPTLFVRRQDASGVLHTSFLSPSQVVGYAEDYIGNPDYNGYDYVVDRLFDFNLTNKRLGLEYDSVDASSFRKLSARLPHAELIDASGVVTWIRIIKSPGEIQLIRESSEIADLAIQRAAAVIRPDVRECDAAAEIAAAMGHGNGVIGSHRISSFVMPAGSRTGTSHLPWTDEKFRRGDHVNVELGAYRYRYAGAIMRTICMGPPSDRLRRLHEATVEGMEAAFATVRPGARCGDVASAFARATDRHGFVKDSRCGYPIGIDWLEPTASLRVGDQTELKPNMTFHLMLGMWVNVDFGYVLSETFRVTETGVETFAKTPRELFVVE